MLIGTHLLRKFLGTAPGQNPAYRRVPSTDWWGTRRKLVRASREPHAEERGQELQTGIGQGALVPVNMTQDGPGKKGEGSTAPLARVQGTQE